MLTPFVLIVMLVPPEATSMKPRSLGIIETRGLNAVGLHSEATAPVMADTPVKRRMRPVLGILTYPAPSAWRAAGKANQRSVEISAVNAPRTASTASLTMLISLTG